MKKKLIYGIIIFCMMSCKVTKVYYHDTSKFDDGEIWGGNVNAFFQSNPDIKVINNNSKKLAKEINQIISKTNTEGVVFEIDDSPYDYAFVTSKGDTLYSNGFVEWRYKNIKSKIPDNNIKEFLKSPN